MASTPFTLAALATSAVPGLIVHAIREQAPQSDDEFRSAVLVCDDEDLLIRVPQTPAAEVRQSAELLALRSLTEGVRSRLPFRVASARGMTRAGDTRAVVSTFLPGESIAAQTLEPDALLIESIAETISAIHALPQNAAHDGGLTVRSSDDVRLEAMRIVERAEATRLLPDVVQARWNDALRTPEVWDFAPTMTHGGLDLSQLLVEDDRIVAVQGWDRLSVGDPATDLAWLLGSGTDVLEQVLRRYAAIRGVGGIDLLRARAVFQHELDIARWLLHGVESHDSAVTDDAVAMLDRLVDRMSRRHTRVAPQSPVLSADEVSNLLDEVPEVDGRLSDTAAYEALDEDRMFHVDTDFIDPLPDPAATDDVDAETVEGSEAPEPDVPEDEVATTEAETQPYAPEDLPPSTNR